jgi:hypothetical protein
MTIAPYLPWLPHEWRSRSTRLLLVGESHYVTDPNEDSDQLTKNIIQGVRNRTRSFPFYTKAAALLANSELTPASGSIWDQVGFVNFVPYSVGTLSNATPAAELWAAGKDRFIDLLTDLQPTHVLSLGQRQWNHIQFPPGWTSIPSTADENVRCWTASDGHRTIATWINHPSSRGFSVERWRPRVESLLRVVT